MSLGGGFGGGLGGGSTGAARLAIKAAAGICIGLLGGYCSYHVSCGPQAGSLSFWLHEPLLRRAVVSWAALGAAAAALAPV